MLTSISKKKLAISFSFLILLSSVLFSSAFAADLYCVVGHGSEKEVGILGETCTETHGGVMIDGTFYNNFIIEDEVEGF